MVQASESVRRLRVDIHYQGGSSMSTDISAFTQGHEGLHWVTKTRLGVHISQCRRNANPSSTINPIAMISVTPNSVRLKNLLAEVRLATPDGVSFIRLARNKDMEVRLGDIISIDKTLLALKHPGTPQQPIPSPAVDPRSMKLYTADMTPETIETSNMSGTVERYRVVHDVGAEIDSGVEADDGSDALAVERCAGNPNEKHSSTHKVRHSLSRDRTFTNSRPTSPVPLTDREPPLSAERQLSSSGTQKTVPFSQPPPRIGIQPSARDLSHGEELPTLSMGPSPASAEELMEKLAAVETQNPHALRVDGIPTDEAEAMADDAIDFLAETQSKKVEELRERSCSPRSSIPVSQRHSGTGRNSTRRPRPVEDVDLASLPSTASHIIQEDDETNKLEEHMQSEQEVEPALQQAAPDAETQASTIRGDGWKKPPANDESASRFQTEFPEPEAEDVTDADIEEHNGSTDLDEPHTVQRTNRRTQVALHLPTEGPTQGPRRVAELGLETSPVSTKVPIRASNSSTVKELKRKRASSVGQADGAAAALSVLEKNRTASRSIRTAVKTSAPQSSARTSRGTPSDIPSASSTKTYKVYFSSSTDIGMQIGPDLLKKLGVEKVDDVAACGVFCTKVGQEFKRTIRSMHAIAFGKDIITDDWLSRGKAAGILEDCGTFFLEDSEHNEYWGSSIRNAVAKFRSGYRPLAGFSVQLSRSLSKAYGLNHVRDLRALFITCGATGLSTGATKKKPRMRTLFIGTNEVGDIEQAHKLGYNLYSKDIIASIVLRGDLNLGDSRYLLVNNDAASPEDDSGKDGKLVTRVSDDDDDDVRGAGPPDGKARRRTKTGKRRKTQDGVAKVDQVGGNREQNRRKSNRKTL